MIPLTKRLMVLLARSSPARTTTVQDQRGVGDNIAPRGAVAVSASQMRDLRMQFRLSYTTAVPR
jgi:hypothetical protein